MVIPGIQKKMFRIHPKSLGTTQDFKKNDKLKKIQEQEEKSLLPSTASLNQLLTVVLALLFLC